MAAPHVAGVAALALQMKPAPNPSSFRQGLIHFAQRHGLPSFPSRDPESNNRWGWGLIDAFALLNSFVSPPPTALPTDVTCEFEATADPWASTGQLNIGFDTRPVFGVPNRVSALIHNAGPNRATDIRVEFGVCAYIAGNPTFNHMGTVRVASLD